MQADRWRRVGSLFDLAVTLTPDRRGRFLDRACDGDPGLRREVEALLRADTGTGPLDRPHTPLVAVDPVRRDPVRRDPVRRDPVRRDPVRRDPVRRDRVGADRVHADRVHADRVHADRVGPYRVVRPLRQGGMGRVELAVRDDDAFDRRVVIKRGRRDLGPDLEIAFRREMRVLARLEHPSIARLYDGGVSGDGEPYFAMEYVEGRSITAHCEDLQLGERRRIQLFVEVCEAVAHAHRHRIVHCDLKPANILVDDAGRPKLLDFGIAQVLDAGSADPETQRGALPLTPAYASPEQLRGEALTVVSDVYALGTVLFELLVGRPTRPSRSGPPATPSRWWRPRSRRLHPDLCADLDAILRRACHPRPERRYATVDGLAADLRRHLNARPVRARGPGWGYRARRFMRRHRGPVIAGAVVVGLFAALFSSSRRLATVQVEVRRVVHQLVDRLVAPAPVPSTEAGMATSPLLDLTVMHLGFEAADRPRMRAMALHTLGRAQLDAGLSHAAAPFLNQALELRRGVHGLADHWDLAASLHGSGAAASRLGDHARAERLLGEALAMRRRLVGPNHAAVAESLEAVATNQWRNGELALAESNFVTAAYTRANVCRHPSSIEADDWSDAAAIRRQRGDLALGDSWAKTAAALRNQVVGEGHPAQARSLDDFGDLAFARGAFEEAESHYREALALRRAALGSHHMSVVHSLHNVARTLGERGRYRAAERFFRETIALRRALGAGQDPDGVTVLNNLAVVLGNAGEHALAERLFQDVLTLRSQWFGSHHPLVAQVHYSLAWLRHDMGDLAAAERGYRRARAILAAISMEDQPPRYYPEVALGRLWLDRGDAEAAVATLVPALEALRRLLAPGHWRVAHAESVLGAAWLALGKRSQALPLLDSSHAVLVRQRGAQAPRTARAARRLTTARSSAS